MMGGHDRLPVVIVGGLHSEARREVVRGLLDTVPSSVALHHDLGTAPSGTVTRTIRDHSGELGRGEAPLVNDCACCALREDLVPELERLAGDGLTRLAVVELWDSVEPQAMADVVAAHGAPAAATDRRRHGRRPRARPPLPGQRGRPRRGRTRGGRERSAYGRGHLGPAAGVRLRRRRHRESGGGRGGPGPARPAAPDGAAGATRSTELARLVLAGFDVEAARTAQHPASARLPQEAEEAGVGTLVWHRHRPFHPQRLFDALEDLCCAAARSRGRFWLADRPDTLLSWDAAGGALGVDDCGPWLHSLPDAAWELVPPERRAAAAMDWHPEHGDRCQHLVFTSPALDREGLTALLDSCLLTDDEYRAGPDGWKPAPAAFDPLLDPAR